MCYLSINKMNHMVPTELPTRGCCPPTVWGRGGVGRKPKNRNISARLG